jgi:hypothetical protein
VPLDVYQRFFVETIPGLAREVAMVKKSGIDLITVKEARKILGKQYRHCTDDEIEQMIIQADFMAAVALEKVVPKTSEVS